jgi:hypothetical protein
MATYDGVDGTRFVPPPNRSIAMNWMSRSRARAIESRIATTSRHAQDRRSARDPEYGRLRACWRKPPVGNWKAYANGSTTGIGRVSFGPLRVPRMAASGVN